MSIINRIQRFFKLKTKAALGRMEDRRQTFEYAYTRRQETLRKPFQNPYPSHYSKGKKQ